MRKLIPALLAGLLLVCLAGCEPRGISAVGPGMVPSQVKDLMGGEPTRVIHGDGIDIGKKTYVYPTGRIHFVNQQVVLVESAEKERTLTEKVREKKRQEEER